MSSIEKCLMHTDADMPVVASVYATITEQRELEVEYIVEDETDAEYSRTIRAEVDRADTFAMAAYFGLKVEQLPQLLFDRSGVAYDSTPSEAERVFQEALEVILEAGVRYRLRNRL